MKKRLVFLGLLVLTFAVFWASPASLRLRIGVQLMGWSGLAEVTANSIADRVMGHQATASREEWQQLSTLLSTVDVDYLSPKRAIVDPNDIAEGHMFLSHLLRVALNLYLDTSPLYPEFISMVSPNLKILGDNPDALYYHARLDPDLTYRVWGTLGREVYLSLTAYESECEGCFSDNACADLNHQQLQYEDDSSFEVWVSRVRPEGAKNWLNTDIGTGKALTLITRHYFEGALSAQLDPSIKVDLHIERVGVDSQSLASKPSMPRETEVADRLKVVQRFIREHSVDMKQDPASAPSWFSFSPNVLGKPVLFRDEQVGVGAVDVVYSAGPVILQSGEVLLIEGVMPECVFANVVLWNRYLQSYDYRFGQPISLNRKQMFMNDTDSSFRILVGPDARPSHWSSEINYLSTGGRPGGTLFFRFLLPQGDVEQPQTTVTNLKALGL